MFCTHCGTAHRPAARFCTNCGTPVAEPPAGTGGTSATTPLATSPADGAGLAAVAEAQSANALGIPASPVTPYSAPQAPLPPIPEVDPGAKAAPRAGTTTPTLDGFLRRFTSENGELDEAAAKKLGVGVGAAIYAVVMVTLILRFFAHPSAGGFFAIVFMGMLTTAVVVGIIAYLANAKETREARTLASLPPSVQHVVAQMDGGAQAAFFNEYERRKKRMVVSYLLMWLFGAHYFYLRQPGLNVAFWFSWLFFGIGALWYWVDVFRMPSLVRAANEQSAREALQTLHIGAAFAQMPAPPSLMTRPVPPVTPINPAPGPELQDR